MDEVFRRILGKLVGADFWVVLGALALGSLFWWLLGTTKKAEQRIRRRQIGSGLIVAILAGCVLTAYHFLLNREPLFSSRLTGILILRIAGDDPLNSLQGDLVAHLNTELQKETPAVPVEVHASNESVDENLGLTDAHRRARTIGQNLNAQVVVWGRKIGEKKFFPRITIVAASRRWAATRERTNAVQDITDLRLPTEIVDEPLYLIQFAAGVPYYDRGDYKTALSHFGAALHRKGASPDELADLRFLTAFCHQKLGTGQKTISTESQQAIQFYQLAAETYAEMDQVRWAQTQSNLGTAYSDLFTGDRAANLEKAIAAYQAALGIQTEKDFPLAWARTQTSLASAYDSLPNGDRRQNLEKAIAACQAALRILTEKDFPADWAGTQNNLGVAYFHLPTGDHLENLQKAIGAYQAALRIRTEKDFPLDWAHTQTNLGSAYDNLPDADRGQNLKNAISAYQAALRVLTEKDFPTDWATTQNNLGNAYSDLRIGDRTQNLQSAIAAYEAALGVFTEKDSPVDWAGVQNNLGITYNSLPSGDREQNLQQAVAAYQAALRVLTEGDFPVEWAMTQNNLGIAYHDLPNGNGAQNLQKAKDCFKAALRVWTEESFPEYHRRAISSLAGVENELQSIR